jgi:PAS domain S-box-containing protein
VEERRTFRALGPGLALMVAACLALAAVETYQFASNAPKLRQSRELVAHTFEVMATARLLELSIRNAERAQRNFLLTGEEPLLAPFADSAEQVPRLLQTLKALTSDNPEQQARMPELEREVAAKLAELQRVREVRQQAGRQAALAFLQQRLASDPMATIGTMIGSVLASEDELLKSRQERAARDERNAVVAAVLGAVISLAILLVGLFLVLQALRRIRRYDQVLRRSEEQFRLLVGGVTDYGIYMLDPQGRVASWNAGATRIKGYSEDEILGQHFSRFYTEEDRQAGTPQKALDTAAREGRFESEGWRVRKDGSRFWVSAVIDALRDPAGRLVGFAKITRDVTERRERQQALQQTQDQLAQAQKMDALGQLTGGIAHDFNNLLTVVQNATELLRGRVQAGAPDALRFIEALQRAADHGSSLTRRLLAFARRQPLEPRPLDVNKLVASMVEILRHTLGSSMAIETVLAGGLWWTFVDANQLETAILNLAVNARDAMPKGGKLTVETANAFLDETYAAVHEEVKPGQYVMLALSDTGIGMSKETVAKAFDPFFTTKEIGQGTGLGLSQVYGFLKQSGGHAKIYSEPGEGSTVKLYLPRLAGAELKSSEEPKPAAAIASGGSETILLVEDDSDVRAFTTEMLGDAGYRVLAAPDGPAALRMLDETREVDLLFTDVGLPNDMNGRQLADEARRRRPRLRVLFTTGYARNAIVHHDRLDPGVDLIAKPYTQTALAAKVREVLNRAA